LKIAHLIYSKQVAGAEKYLLSLLPGLKSKGIDCSLICVTTPAFQDQFSDYCAEMRQLGVPAVLLVSRRNHFKTAKLIAGYLRSNDIPDLHSHLFKADLLAVMVKRLFFKKIFLLSTKHGYQEKYLVSWPSHKGKIIRNGYYYISKFVARNIDEHVAVSNAISQMYYGLTLTKTPPKYIHHGIELTYKDGWKDPSFRISENQLVIAGRLELMKGHKYLIDAMTLIKEVFPKVKLLVIGDGSQRELLEKQAADAGIKEHIDFLGYRADVHAFISNSDIIILPSLFEPFGLVYIEAFALHVPVIAFDVPATNEIIENNETGMLAPVFDSKKLAEHVLFLLKNNEERKRIADKAFDKYITHFNRERMISDTIAWYRSIIKKQ
jgi:glycosyltransferase involved in cell wall biosynthesis